MASASAQFIYPYPYGAYHGFAPVAPVAPVAKYTLKTSVLEANKDAKTPAATTFLAAKEYKQDVVTPLTYSYPYATYPYAYPVVAAPAEAQKKVESSRKKRGVFVVPKPSQFYNDLAYKSVDLNQDGQPDKAAVVTSYSYPQAYAYPAYSAYPAYPYGFPFYG